MNPFEEQANMNPFEDQSPFETQPSFEEQTENNIIEDNKIEVWVECRGRKSDTYIHGLKMTDTQLKEHLKIIKKSMGCNGSIKELVNDSITKKVFHLQGNHKDYLVNYLLNLGIDSASLCIKG
jgi:translation initiation factor 1 (eIF-1/SUI1)